MAVEYPCPSNVTKKGLRLEQKLFLALPTERGSFRLCSHGPLYRHQSHFGLLHDPSSWYPAIASTTGLSFRVCMPESKVLAHFSALFRDSADVVIFLRNQECGSVNPFVWQKRLFVLGALGTPACISMLQAS